MKKFLAIALAIVMMAALAVPAFAATLDEKSTNVDYDDSEPANPIYTPDRDSEAIVSYGVSETYTVVLPDAVNFGTEKTVTLTDGIQTSNIVIAGNKALKISISSSNSWLMRDDANGCTPVPYTMTSSANGATFDANNLSGIVLEVEASNGVTDGSAAVAASGNTTLTFTTPGTTQAGSYQDTLTFTIAIETPTT